jgi:hypothetical protein
MLTDAPFPLPLSTYQDSGEPLLNLLRARVEADPLNLIATAIFLLAILHTFAAARFTHLAHSVALRHQASGQSRPSISAELLHFLGEVEVVFGLWTVPLLVVIALLRDWTVATHYLNDTVTYTEPLFVIVIMLLTATRPVISLAEAVLRRAADLGRGTPGAWWVTILTVAPVLGSFITEPAAMTIGALLLARQFFDLQPTTGLRYATLGLLFVNVSIGGTLTNFAAPPVLMVARPWDWSTGFMLSHFGWRAAVAIAASTTVYYALFRREFRALALRPAVTDIETPDEDAEAAKMRLLPIPWWVTLVHLLFIAWTVMNAHYPALFLGGFLFFLGFTRATAAYQSRIDFRTPLLVGFFLAGLVIHGGLQGWWIAPLLSRLAATPLFLGATVLTAFNDNALITYLSTLVPSMNDTMRAAVVEGAVTGGGLTIIANAPNPAGQALLGRFFDDAISPLRLFISALLPTLIAAAAFRLL